MKGITEDDHQIGMMGHKSQEKVLMHIPGRNKWGLGKNVVRNGSRFWIQLELPTSIVPIHFNAD